MPSRILLAEDNDEIRRLVSIVLKADGHQVVAVADGGEAIAQISDIDFDAILLDLMMPTTSGWDVLAWMVENRPTVAKACVIVLTAAVREAKDVDPASVFAIVTKPFDLLELRTMVRTCLEQRSR